MLSQETGDYPLGLLTDCILGPLPTSALKNEPSIHIYRFTLGLANWYRLTAWLNSSDVSELKSNKTLSKKQWDSYQHLWQWWTAVYQDPAYSLASILQIVSLSRDLSCFDSQPEQYQHVWNTAIRNLRLRRWPKGNFEEQMTHIRCTSTNDSGVGRYTDSYNDRMFLHWEMEFATDQRIESWNRSRRRISYIHGARRDISIISFCQLTAMSCLSETKSRLEGENKEINSPKQKDKVVDSPSKNDVFDKNHLSKDLLDVRTDRGPSIEACPWLEKDDVSTDLPYYLWDVSLCETVMTSGLDFIPQYTVISHTWGRWKKTTSIQLHGVPWNIPENTRFDVSSIPTLLAQIPTKTPYVWLDLVCIPQDSSPIASKEIARQARIFRNAKYAIAWLNDVENLDILSAALRWYVLQLLEVPAGSQDDRRRLQLIEEAWDKVARQGCGLFEYRLNEPETLKKFVLNPWFTSLWTLQEIAVRPDMWFCSREWEVLSCDFASPLPFSGVTAIHVQFFKRDQEGARTKEVTDLSEGLGAWEVEIFHYLTGLNQIPLESQARLLSIGDRRECTGRRAEAIMSAVGATAWYEAAIAASSATDYEESTEGLILGKYPLSFIDEVRAKMPGDFFFSVINQDICEVGDDLQACPYKGTMLPFSAGFASFESLERFRRLNMTDHKSVKQWSILNSGAVRISRACILSSREIATDNMNTILPTKLIGSSLEKATEAMETFPDGVEDGLIDIHQFFRTHVRELFAVVGAFRYMKNHSDSVFSGIVLQPLSSGALIEVGNFLAKSDKQINLPATSDVNWLVL